MTGDDLKTVEDAIRALMEARDALKAARAGGGEADYEQFAFKVGFARGLLSRVSERITAPMTQSITREEP